MGNVSTVIHPIHYQFPPTGILDALAARITSPVAKHIIDELHIFWTPTKAEYDLLKKIAKSSKDAIKTLRYVPEDSRTPDHFMSQNGPIEITYSRLLDTIKASEPWYPVSTFEDISKMYMLPGFEVDYCGNCDRVILKDKAVSSKTVADIYGMELKENVNLCTFEFICLCLEVEHQFPESLTVAEAPKLPDGRPVIWVGDPGWNKHPEEYRRASLKYQGNF